MNFKKICLLLLVSSCFLIPVTHAMEEDVHQVYNPQYICTPQGPKIEARLKELGIELPTPAKPIANFVPFKKMGSKVYISGQLPFIEDKKIMGKLGENLTIEQGQEAAKMCLYNVLAHLKVAAGGDLDRVQECIRLGGAG